MFSSEAVCYQSEISPTVFINYEQRKLIEGLVRLSLLSPVEKNDLQDIVGDYLAQSSLFRINLTNVFTAIFPDIDRFDIPAMQASAAEIKQRLYFYRRNIRQQDTLNKIKNRCDTADDFVASVYKLYCALVSVNSQCISYLNMMQFLAPLSIQATNTFWVDKSRIVGFIKHDRLSQQLVANLTCLIDSIKCANKLRHATDDETQANQRRLGF